MKSYALIHQLINYVEQLENQHPGKEIGMEEFTGFLLTQTNASNANAANADTRFGPNEVSSQQLAYQLDNNIGRLFIYMSRYAKIYVKKALDGTPLQSAEDFTCLAVLLTHNQLSKTELISKNLLEKTSGTEIIKRLINAGLVKQWDNEEDRRSKHVAITNEGRQLLYRVFNDMNHVGKIITGTLNGTEKLMLQFLLQKLEDFHYHHHEQKSITAKADIQRIVENELG